MVFFFHSVLQLLFVRVLCLRRLETKAQNIKANKKKYNKRHSAGRQEKRNRAELQATDCADRVVIQFRSLLRVSEAVLIQQQKGRITRN
ncbi:hypothetical protein F5H01DRAFT_348748 [Linnemannia elongata]|nr:hypothetical protein F5H01DRAFT_348748 [Linnemannia elongata]